MDAKLTHTYARLGAYASLGGAITMLIGAALWVMSGTDLDERLAAGTVLLRRSRIRQDRPNAVDTFASVKREATS